MRKKLKVRYEVGGDIPYAQLGTIASSLYDNLDPVDKYGARSDFSAGASSALKGAGTGAAIGTAILPGIGTAVGAGLGTVIGAAKGVKDNNNAQDFEEEQKKLQELEYNKMGLSRLSTYDKTGSNTNQIYAKYGGSLKQLSNNSVEVEGASHENGGVNLGQGVEVEGGETLNKDFVFSEELGFAQRHKPIARAIGKLEKKVPNNITTNTIKFLKEKEENLKSEQEALKQELGITPIGTTQYSLGGYTDPEDKRVKILADSTFASPEQHQAYYRQKALGVMKPEDIAEYQNFLQKDGQSAADAIIAGRVIFPTYTNPIKTAKHITYTNPVKSRELGIRPESAKQGFNNNGRLGFRTIR